MAWGSKKSGGGGPAWLALLVALLALWIAWSGFRRTGGTLDELLVLPGFGDRVEERASESEDDWSETLAAAREKLLRRRDDVDQERDLAAVQRDIAEIRAALERARDGARGARESWENLDADLERLQEQVRDGSERAQGTLDNLVQRMKDAT